jgi:zinc protease
MRAPPHRLPLALVLVLALLIAGASVLRAAPAAASAKVEEIRTPRGLTVWYVREPTIPIISLSLEFRGGSAFDPAGKEGLASLVSGLMNEGAGELDSQAFQRAIVNEAISFSADAGLDGFTIGLQTLSDRRDKAFDLLGLALTRPRFDADAVERVRAQYLHLVSEARNDPEKRSAEGFFRLVFGQHPYGSPKDGTAESIAAITLDDLKTYARERFARDNVVIGAAGDVEPAEIARLVDHALGELPANAAPAALPDATLPSAGSLRVEHLDVPQSVVAFGLAGLKRADPDFYAAYVMNYTLGGGGFTSRLYQEVREKRGLAYLVYSYLYPLRAAGLYLGGVATENSRVAESLALIRAEIARMAEHGVTAEELAAAKRHLTGAYALRFDTGDKIANMLVGLQVDGLGIDYFEHRNDYINAVTVEDVARVAKRLLHPDRLVVVVAGNPQGLDATP